MKIIDYLAEEEALTPQQAKRVKMTELQKFEYKLYRQGCRVENVEPVRADFLTGEIPWCVINHMELEQNEIEIAKRGRAMAAVAGR
jgi:hypothetical protein